MTQDDFFICKAEEGGVAVATATDDNAADEKSDKSIWQLLNIRCTRACLKNHSRNLHAPLCGIFHPNSVAVARYGALIRAKSPTNYDAHLAESLFQTRSSILSNICVLIPEEYRIGCYDKLKNAGKPFPNLNSVKIHKNPL